MLFSIKVYEKCIEFVYELELFYIIQKNETYVEILHSFTNLTTSVSKHLEYFFIHWKG